MIDLTRHAHDFLKDLQAEQFKQVTKKVLSLLRDPYPQDCKHLADHPGFRRVDVGEFRVCYQASGAVVRIAVIRRRNDAVVYREIKMING
ncbi:type II toxin-antitoxin system RelE/ParE family toxin [Thermodesulfovibrionales bacterium]|nr:type II toxin-antitoxin system RelE/ParE family toxin [Thermodesulfovibrionales bacterium]MCL0038475.1 type II toxin-antitoxin system RelE/ParE family toxin [Thermodesulfovibrionales bacterium]MCL0042387.1 type II toxin-antitoxin system RelE/ParE family toxin [Thermodesulfovibrionales bacterium]MCL0061862.1 type II toxin-antitoxin system RelE/ParE family toxin [Thermodesulfovibrionales bacterium]MCL0107075.1 type II toxin-antitoxin system RelE/ParE family toxin [Thermodesulfovibrionales bact